MAYTREETEHVEIDYPLEQIWENIPKAIAQLEWVIQESDKNMCHLTIKTKGAFMSYASTIKIALVSVNDKTTRMLINGETPVTTITSVLDFGRTRERIERFIVALAKLMEKKN
ncbi:MAG: hypothetical protein LBE70_03055 [Nitrososphaerota archaeon]|jgi:hypothetical protein|nr:hypothetical protein [Nitrososphaerota archaeon]